MRLIAWALTGVLLGVAAWAGLHLWQVVQIPPQQITPLTLTETASEPQPPAPQTPPQAWPDVFGRYVAPEPQPLAPPTPPTPTPDPQPPTPPLPPLDSLGYQITGIVRAGDGAIWAMVSHPTGSLVLQAGDALGDNMRVTRIGRQGIWLDRGGETDELLALEE